MLCSDGLWSGVRDEQIARAQHESGSRPARKRCRARRAGRVAIPRPTRTIRRPRPSAGSAPESAGPARPAYASRRLTTLRPSGRAPDQLRPVRITRGFTRHAEGSVLVEFGDTRVLVHGDRRGRRARLPARQGRRLDHGRVRHAAARHAHAQRARGGTRQAGRPHAGDPAADRPLAARGRRPARARRAHRHARLRRAAGRWRHAHGVDHRRLRRARRCHVARSCARQLAHGEPAARPGRRRLGRHRAAASRCSTSTTPRTPRPRRT